MRISQDRSNYFYFSFEDDDYHKFGFELIKRFTNRFKAELPGGKNGDRFWIGKMKAWAIKKERRDLFMRLINEYFNLTKQGYLNVK